MILPAFQFFDQKIINQNVSVAELSFQRREEISFSTDINKLMIQRNNFFIEVNIIPRQAAKFSNSHTRMKQNKNRNVKRRAERIFIKQFNKFFFRDDMTLDYIYRSFFWDFDIIRGI